MDYGAVGLGFGIGVLANFLLTTRSLLNDLRKMQYDGFKVSFPPPRPKTVPDPTSKIRED